MRSDFRHRGEGGVKQAEKEEDWESGWVGGILFHLLSKKNLFKIPGQVNVRKRNYFLFHHRLWPGSRRKKAFQFIAFSPYPSACTVLLVYEKVNPCLCRNTVLTCFLCMTICFAPCTDVSSRRIKGRTELLELTFFLRSFLYFWCK